MTSRSPALFGGRANGSVRVVGARVRLLKDVPLEIPRNDITVFTGVSGSGRSSIVFDTVAVEARRQFNGMFGWFIRACCPRTSGRAPTPSTA
ncbi:hypothetical protein AB0C18_02100 [Nonomuraea muscovyensis]|uniref:hypothetical protein n=1 Tax=Nonomuraea muscovyensis TaxID=1124761 RepID=UPI0033D63ACC